MEKIIASAIKDMSGHIWGKNPPGNFELMDKVNELVDAVNELTKEVEKLKEKQPRED